MEDDYGIDLMTQQTQSTKTRVCILQHYLPPDPSGAGKQAITLARALEDHRCEVVFIGDRSEDGPSEGRTGGIPVTWIPTAGSDPDRLDIVVYWLRLAVELVRLRHAFDVLHVHAVSFLNSAAIPLARLLGKRVLVRSSLEGEMPDPARSRSDWLHYRMLSVANRFVVISRRLEREYLDSGISGERVTHIPNGVDTSVYSPVTSSEQASLRHALGLPVDDTIMIYHGVFIERKSIHWVLPLLEEQLQDDGFSLLLVGSPGRDEERTRYFNRLQKLIRHNAGHRSIFLKNFKEDVHRYLQASDLYLLPSTGEGLPNALLEAMAVGLVSVVSRTSGSEEVIEHGKSGFLFQPRDEASFSASVDNAMEAVRSPLGRDIADSARQRILSEYSIDAVARKYAKQYNRITRR